MSIVLSGNLRPGPSVAEFQEPSDPGARKNLLTNDPEQRSKSIN